MPAAAYFFGKYLMSDLNWFERMVRLLVGLNFYMGFTAIAEHMGWSSLVWPRTILNPEFAWPGRSMGVFLQPAVLGVFFGMILPFQVYLHLTAKQYWVRWLHLAGIAMCVLGLFFTYTRGGWLATGIGLITLAVTGRRIYFRRLLMYAVIMAVVGTTGLLSLKNDAFYQERMGNQNTIEGRINIMVAAFRMWQANPVFGVGFKRFNDEAPQYRETVNIPVYGLIKAGIDRESSPHDIYVAVLAEEGAVGAGMQVLIYVLIFKVAILLVRRSRRGGIDDPDVRFVPPIVALMVVYAIGGATFDYRFFETPNSLFFLFAGILVRWSTTLARGHAAVRTVAS